VESAHYQQSPLLQAAGFRHAFFTRRGGVSSGAYESLNFSVAVGDLAENVQENLARAARALGVDPERVYFLSQVHGREVKVLTGAENRQEVLHERGDGVIGTRGDLACAVRVADCAPILIGDKASGAAAAVHAGWRGTVGGVVAAAVERLRAELGGPGELVAAIGPHISLARFEVSADVAAELLGASPDPDVVDHTCGPKPHVDLRRILRAQLVQLGLADDAIDDVGGCTVGDASLYFSYRRDGSQSGRHLAAIVPRGF
jgi:hypothetical protein